jgi:Uma2 family endonuclease
VLDVWQIAPESPRPITRAEYDRLVSMGFFDDEKVELLYGVLVRMTPQDPPHSFSVQTLNRLLLPRLLSRAEVRIQAPFAASDDSEPEPDVAVVPEGDYRREHPTVAWLVVEVANTSQRKDRNVKAKLYAESRVTEYWIVDVPARKVELYRQPVQGTYTSVVVRHPGDDLGLVQFPDITFRVDDLF